LQYRDYRQGWFNSLKDGLAKLQFIGLPIEFFLMAIAVVVALWLEGQLA
jgi:hypothetical protein